MDYWQEEGEGFLAPPLETIALGEAVFKNSDYLAKSDNYRRSIKNCRYDLFIKGASGLEQIEKP